MYPQTQLDRNNRTFNTQSYADINTMRNIFANCQAQKSCAYQIPHSICSQTSYMNLKAKCSRSDAA